MAEKYPLANGLWSNAANWNGGTKPTSGDVVYANNKILDIDENVDVLELRTDAGTTAVGGGYFDVVSDDLTVSCDFIWPDDNDFGIQVSSNSGTTTIIGDVYIPKGNSATRHCGILIQGTCQLNVIGSILNKDNSGSQGARDNSGIIINVSGGRLNLTGDVNGGTNTANSNQPNAGIYIKTVDWIINVTGDVIGGPIGGGSILNINAGIYVETTNNVVNVIGNVIGGFSFQTPGIYFNASVNNVNITGVAQSNNSSPAVEKSYGVINNTVTMFGDIINDGGQMAILIDNLVLDNDTEMSWKLIDDTNNDRYLYSVGSGVLGQAAESDVRKDVVYGPSSELTGELEPVVVDTAQLASDLLDDIQTSSHVVAQRLRAASTDDSVGQIVASTLGNP